MGGDGKGFTGIPPSRLIGKTSWNKQIVNQYIPLQIMQMKTKVGSLLMLQVLLLLLVINARAQEARWTEGKAKDWYAKQKWITGCNFQPSTAVNQLEMFQKDSFDPVTIDRELGWAENLG